MLGTKYIYIYLHDDVIAHGAISFVRYYMYLGFLNNGGTNHPC